MATVYAQDIWMPAVTITTSNNSFRIVENVGVTDDVRTVTIAAGTYYMHGDATLTAAGLLGFFDALATALNAVATNTYSFLTVTPVQSSSFTLSGIRIKATTATVDFKVDWDNASLTMDPAWFGFRLANATITTRGSLTNGGGNEITSTTSGADEVIDSDFTVSKRWYSFSHGNTTHAAVDKRAFRYGNRRYSSSRLSDAVAVEWDTGRVRNFRYEYIVSQHLFAERGESQAASGTASYAQPVGAAAWASTALLDGDDIYQGFEQYVWEPMAQLTPVLVQHNVSTPALNDVVDHPHELVRLLNPSQAQDFRNVIELQRRGGEFYNLDIDVQIDPSWDFVSH